MSRATAQALTASWTIAASTSFDPSGNLSVPITVDPVAPQLFIRLQTQ